MNFFRRLADYALRAKEEIKIPDFDKKPTCFKIGCLNESAQGCMSCGPCLQLKCRGCEGPMNDKGSDPFFCLVCVDKRREATCPGCPNKKVDVPGYCDACKALDELIANATDLS